MQISPTSKISKVSAFTSKKVEVDLKLDQFEAVKMELVDALFSQAKPFNEKDN
jgi:hypothetical protein